MHEGFSAEQRKKMRRTNAQCEHAFIPAGGDGDELVSARTCAHDPGPGSMIVIAIYVQQSAIVRLWFSCHQPNDIRLTLTFPIRFIPHDLVMYDLQGIKQM